MREPGQHTQQRQVQSQSQVAQVSQKTLVEGLTLGRNCATVQQCNTAGLHGDASLLLLRQVVHEAYLAGELGADEAVGGDERVRERGLACAGTRMEVSTGPFFFFRSSTRPEETAFHRTKSQQDTNHIQMERTTENSPYHGRHAPECRCFGCAAGRSGAAATGQR
jgi:hypothetical protein